MERVYDKCCGVDVHKKLMVACFRQGSKQEIREFGATTRELLALADWLKEGACEMVAMESTASYWKPLYNILEFSELRTMVVNAHHMPVSSIFTNLSRKNLKCNFGKIRLACFYKRGSGGVPHLGFLAV